MSKNGAYHGWYSTKVPKKLTFLRALKQILVKALTSRLKVPEKHPEFPDEDVRKWALWENLIRQHFMVISQKVPFSCLQNLNGFTFKPYIPLDISWKPTMVVLKWVKLILYVIECTLKNVLWNMVRKIRFVQYRIINGQFYTKLWKKHYT